MILGGLYEIWNILYKNLEHKRTDEQRVNPDQRLIKEMIIFIQKNYQRELSLGEISAQGGVGKTKCTEIFKRYTKMTPIEYLKSYRIEKAAVLLEETDVSISDIAYEVGFSGASYFSEMFRQVTGYTPLKYRKMSKDKKDKSRYEEIYVHHKTADN